MYRRGQKVFLVYDTRGQGGGVELLIISGGVLVGVYVFGAILMKHVH